MPLCRLSGMDAAGFACQLLDNISPVNCGFAVGAWCDISTHSRRFLRLWQPGRCGFKDVLDLRSGALTAPCAVHHRACPVGNADLMVGSPECKDWSLFGKRRLFNGPGAVSDAAWLDELEARRPSVFVEENVPVKDMTRLCARLSSTYHIHKFSIDSLQECGARRHRLFIIGRTGA